MMLKSKDIFVYAYKQKYVYVTTPEMNFNISSTSRFLLAHVTKCSFKILPLCEPCDVLQFSIY